MSKTTSPAPRRSRADWERLMEQYEAGGLKQRVFCEQHGIGYSTFYYWRKQLRHSTPIKNHSEPLLELPMLPVDEHPDWRVELDLGRGVVLRLK